MGHHSSKHPNDHRRTPSQPWPTKTPGLPATKSEPSNSTRHYDLSNFAVITVIFNPVKFKTRYDHYQRFEAHMSDSGVYLITVECIFESAQRFDLPRQTFEVTRADDRHHIQLTAPSILWMKENLINIAVHRLPQNIEYVAWIDADIEFDRLDWPHLAIAELQRYPVVQLFELSFFLGPGGKKDILRRDYSFGYSIRKNKPIDPQRYNEWYPHPGYAWAMRRSTFNAMGGLLDFCIIGSADLHFAFALLNRIEETMRPSLHPDYQKLAMIWGNRVAQVAQNGANVGYLPINLWHFWHGDRNNRSYVNRWLILERHQYSPPNHLEKNDDTGLLRLAYKHNFGHPELIARIEALERDIVNYFKSRDEDNNVKRTPAQPPSIAKKTPFIANKTQTHRSNASKPTGFKSSNWRAGGGPHIWSSGPSGTHVDDDDPYLNQCTCPGHHHHDNHNCPCSSHYIDDQHCWNPSQHEDHHHHHDDHPDHCYPSNEHHHHDDHHPDYCSPVDHHFGHEHQSHGVSSNIDNYGYNYDTTSGAAGFTSSGGNDYSSGGGFTNTDYGGPGSFY